MRSYELVVLLHPDLEIDVDTPTKKLEKLIEAADGKIVKRDNWGKKRLAYPIKKQDFAVYLYFELSLPNENVRGLEHTILLTEEVIRHILVSREPLKQEAKKRAAAKPTEEKAAAGEEK